MAYKPTFYTMREEYVKERRKEQELIRRVRDSIREMLTRPMFPKTEKASHELA